MGYWEIGRNRQLNGSIGGAVWLVLAGTALILFTLGPAWGQTAAAEGTNSPALAAEGTQPQSPGADGAAPPSPQAVAAAPQPSTADDTQDEKQRLAVNPLTGQTSALGTDYTPLTPEERWKLYYKQSYWSIGAYFGPLFAALALDQAAGSPQQWGGGFRGYGRRVASRWASGDVVQNSFQFPVAALLKEDVRYIASNEGGFRRRVGHAIVYSFLTYNSQGRPTLNVANIGGYYFAAGVSTVWLPGRQNLASYTLSNGSESLGLSVAVNLLQEFWPDIRHRVFRRK